MKVASSVLVAVTFLLTGRPVLGDTLGGPIVLAEPRPTTARLEWTRPHEIDGLGGPLQNLSTVFR